MKTLIEKLDRSKTESFNVIRYTIGNNGKSEELLLRMHDDYEIVIILDGSGKRFVGNKIANFSKGDIFLTGPFVPHCAQADRGGEIRVMVIHFYENAFGKGFFELPENHLIFEMLIDSRSGILFNGRNTRDFYEKFTELDKQRPFERLLTFFRLLDEMARLPNRRLLSNRNFEKTMNKKDYRAVNKIYDYIMTNFDGEKITLTEISNHVNMSPATFCRYFKKHFRKTFTHFLNEVRIGHACKKLQETNKNISEIAFASGYNHLTHFNKQFKRIMGYSPKEYRRELE